MTRQLPEHLREHLRKIRRRRYSPEIERDAKIEIEPQAHQAADGLACDIAEHHAYLKRRDARALLGSAPDPIPVPATRAECPADRREHGCGAYSCRHHLWLQTTLPGRPGLANVPRGPAGLTQRVLGDLGPKAPPTLEPRWLDGGTLSPSCALDVADEGRHDNLALGVILRRHRTLVARSVKEALAALRAKGHAHGFEILVEED
jgi:hypothetical protein